MLSRIVTASVQGIHFLAPCKSLQHAKQRRRSSQKTTYHLHIVFASKTFSHPHAAAYEICAPEGIQIDVEGALDAAVSSSGRRRNAGKTANDFECFAQVYCFGLCKLICCKEDVAFAAAPNLSGSDGINGK